MAIVLKGVLAESEQYYLDAKRKIRQQLLELPEGSIKRREISGQKYYYLQQRKGLKVIHKYLGKDKPKDLIEKIDKRNLLKRELKKTIEALNILRKMKKKKQ